LKAYDLVPVFSYLFLGGKCRYCGERISIRYPLIELLTGLMYAGLSLIFGLSWPLLVYGILFSLLLIAFVIDLEHQIIPNGLVLTGVVAGLMLNLLGINRSFLDGIFGLLAGGGSLLLISLLAFLILRKEGIGGGDIKLMAMCGLFLGWKLTFLALLFSIYIGGFFSIFLLIFRLTKMKEAIAYGPFIAMGTVIAAVWGSDILEWYIRSFL